MNATEMTALDAAGQIAGAIVYLGVALAALGTAPHDERTRVFFGFALLNALGSSIPTAGWFLGVKDHLAFDRIPLGIMLAAVSVAALLLFHFSQVFPRRRPWIQSSGAQMPIAYVLAPAAVFLLVRLWPASRTEATPMFGLLFLLFGFPLAVLLGLVLPIASIVSLLRSLRDFRDTTDLPDPRPALAGILLSQLGGGAIALLVLGPIRSLAPDSWAFTFATLAAWTMGMLTPAAFAAGIWKHRVLEIPVDESAEVETQ